MFVTIAGLAFAVSCVSTENTRAPEGALRVGALIPFTGDLAGSGANIERGMRMAVDIINDHGGVAGRPVHLVIRDTRSDVASGMAAARELLDDENVIALLGPQNEELAVQLLPLIREREVVLVSGGVMSPRLSSLDRSNLFFRTFPSAGIYSAALAARMVNDGIESVTIINTDDEFGFTFSNVLTSELVLQGIATHTPRSVAPEQPSYTETIRRVLETQPDAIALATYARTGAAIVQEWALVSSEERWYLSPPLRDEVFVRNIPPHVIDGAAGVFSPLSIDADLFATDFREHWNGVDPQPVSYFYYDAMATLGLAVETAAAEAGELPSTALIRDRLFDVSRPTGRHIAWSDLPTGLEQARAGEDIDYRGASSNMDFDDLGDLERPQAKLWFVSEDQITEEAPE